MVIDFAAAKNERQIAAERAQLRAKIEKLEVRQANRVIAVREQIAALEETLVRSQLEIDNLRAQLGAGG